MITICFITAIRQEFEIFTVGFLKVVIGVCSGYGCGRIINDFGGKVGICTVEAVCLFVVPIA